MHLRHSNSSRYKKYTNSLCECFVNGNNVLDHLAFLRERGKVLQAAAASPSAVQSKMTKVAQHEDNGESWDTAVVQVEDGTKDARDGGECNEEVSVLEVFF